MGHDVRAIDMTSGLQAIRRARGGGRAAPTPPRGRREGPLKHSNEARSNFREKRICPGAAAAFAGACGSAPPTPQVTAPPPPVVATPRPRRPTARPAPSEVVVKDLCAGEGPALGFKSAANMWYSGWLYDGCKADFKGAPFDSNIGKMPLPLMVGVGKVIKGWDEGIVGMKAKGKRLLIIPPNKAYGSREVPSGKIPPNSTLVFEVEVMNIVDQPQ
jgi:hypothetical protein